MTGRAGRRWERSFFRYHGEPLPYFDRRYNTTRVNERRIEVPIARRFIGRLTVEGVPLVDGLEVGNVLGHYGHTLHRVVDRYEQAEGVENLDVFDITGQHPWAVAISTLEHVRHDEDPRGQRGATRALAHLLGHVLAPGGRLLVTVPLGYHPVFDHALRQEATAPRAGDRHALYCRTNPDPAEWEQLPLEQWPDQPVYGPMAANWLYVGELGAWS